MLSLKGVYEIRLPSLLIANRRPLLALVLTLLALAVACSSATATPPAIATPAPTVVPATAPILTPSPTATPTPLLAEVAPSALDLVTNQVMGVLEEILEELGPRENGTDEEAAAKYLQAAFQELGYDTEIQEFIVEDLALAGMGLTLNTPEPMEFSALPLDKTGLGDVSGILTPVGLAMPGDIPEGGLEDRIALAERGIITFQAKAENVFAAGAVGLVIYNNVFRLFRGVLATQPDFGHFYFET